MVLTGINTVSAITGLPSYPKVVDDGRTIDLRSNPCCGKIRDQGKCGSCYAFSALQVLNFNGCVKCGDSTPRYSAVQNIVDCSDAQGNKGCDGGMMDNVFQYIKQAPGVNLEQSYPYRAEKGTTCKLDASTAEYKEVTGYTEVKQDENEMMYLVADTKSLCVAVKVDNNFQMYKGGVFGNEFNCRATSLQLNHAVTIEGYGKDNTTGKMYWLVKNSWNETWGEKGYIRILRGSCCLGICLKAGYPLFECPKKEATTQ